MSTPFRTLHFAPALMLLSSFAAVAQQQSAPASVGGEVMFVSGQAARVKAGGTPEAISKGMTLLEGDTIRTSADSHVYVRMRDGGLLVVRPASELHVDLWRYDAARPQDSTIKYTLDSGVARHVSGAGAKAARDKFRFNTPMAAIGVRGTDFTVLADPALTRISVQSGGVIMNSFGNGCQADGVGPCEGTSAVELFASARDKLLQLRAGERRPEVIEDASATPDRHRPSTGGEPTAQRAPADSEILAASRTGEFVALAERSNTAPPASGSAAVDPSPVTAPPQVSLPPPEPPKPDITIAKWGRWAAVAGQDAEVIKIADLLHGRSLIAVNTYYALASNTSTGAKELPGSGIGNFKLLSHEGIVTDTATQARMASTASDASLKIDFGARRFETSMTVNAGTGSAAVSIPIKAAGFVESNGRFGASVPLSPVTIQGVVGGSQGSEAVYLYQRSVKGYDASGAAAWLK